MVIFFHAVGEACLGSGMARFYGVRGQSSTLDGGKEGTSDANGHRKNTIKNDFQQSTYFILSSRTQGPSQKNTLIL